MDHISVQLLFKFQTYLCLSNSKCIANAVFKIIWLYAIGGRSSLPLHCHGCRFTRNHCACTPMLYISELCEDCTVANEIDYAWTSIHDNGQGVTSCDVVLQQPIEPFCKILHSTFPCISLIPRSQSHDKWGVIVKTNNQTSLWYCIRNMILMIIYLCEEFLTYVEGFILTSTEFS